jgi:hypothetical protein
VCHACNAHTSRSTFSILHTSFEDEWLSEQEALYSHTRSTFDAGTRPQSPNLLTIEKHWPQDTSPSLHIETLTQPRFDWRLRAPSRVNPKSKDEPSSRTAYVRRIQPPLITPQPGDPFFDEIQTNQSQYVIFLSVLVHPKTVALVSYPSLHLNSLRMSKSSKTVCRLGLSSVSKILGILLQAFLPSGSRQLSLEDLWPHF